MLRRRHVALAQAAFWCATGLWPLLHYKSFEAITGHKKEPWLVKTAGLLITTIGAAIGLGAIRKRLTPELKLAGTLGSASVAGIELRYAAARRISPVYLLDVPVQLAFVLGWMRAPV